VPTFFSWIVFYEAIAGVILPRQSFLETSDRILHHDQVPLCELNPKLLRSSTAS